MPQTAQIEVSVASLPEVVQLARAARDVVDHAERRPDNMDLDAALTQRGLVAVPAVDFNRLAATVSELLPGAEVA